MAEILVELVLAILSGMGLGGGGLFVIYLTLVLGEDQLTAQGANLLFFIATAAVSTLLSARHGRIEWKTTLPISISGALLSLVGAFVAGAVSGTLLRRIFGGMLVIGGLISLISKKAKKGKD